jgi:hypothetical protein
MQVFISQFPDERLIQTSSEFSVERDEPSVPSRTVLEFADAVPSGMMLSDQAARSMS